MINWFPGHMNKTLREMGDKAKLCDCFVYVLDARCPEACLNPEFVKIIKDKPIVYVLNKSDLANSKKSKEWKAHFDSLPNSKCVLTPEVVRPSNSLNIHPIALFFLLIELALLLLWHFGSQGEPHRCCPGVYWTPAWHPTPSDTLPQPPSPWAGLF